MDSINKLIFTLLLVFPLTVFSSAQLQVNFKATNFQQLLKTSTGILASVKYSARNNAGRAVYGLRTSSLSKQIINNVLKKRAFFSPWGIGIQVALTAAGYYFNSSTGEVFADNGVSGQYSTALGLCASGSTHLNVNSTYSQCIPLVESFTNDTVQSNFKFGTGFFGFKNSLNQTIGDWNAHNNQPQSDNSSDYDITDPVPLSDNAFYASTASQFGDEELRGYLNDPFTGHPDKDLTPLVSSAQDLTDDYDAANDGDPLTDPDTDNQYDNGEETFTEDPTELPNEQLEAEEHPETDQCKLTPDALGCQEFGTELTSVEIPTEELSFSFNPISLASNTSCPAPSTLNLSFGTLQMSNQPLCDFLSGINNIVIAICTILSVYILTGGVKNG